jgi:hypothetical protein
MDETAAMCGRDLPIYWRSYEQSKLGYKLFIAKIQGVMKCELGIVRDLASIAVKLCVA